VEELLALGLPDFRTPALGAAIADVVDRTWDETSAEDRVTLTDFVRGLPRRFDAVAACGLRDSLVHGDFHPGNFRGDGRSLTLLDWGDSCGGHPLLDQAAFLDPIPNGTVGAVRAHWLQQWREAVPGSDPARAWVLLAPVAAARQAVVYRRFLDNIEPSEHPYHRADPANWLKRAAALVHESY
jgi:aminoglycoside phosphotransferase (APT) family kinase protein